MDLKFEIEDFSEEVDTMEMYILSNFETMGIDELRIAVLMQSSLLKQNTEILAKLQALNGGEELQEAHGDGFRYGPDDDACDECVNGCVDAHVQDPDGMADCVDGCCGGSCSC